MFQRAQVFHLELHNIIMDIRLPLFTRIHRNFFILLVFEDGTILSISDELNILGENYNN